MASASSIVLLFFLVAAFVPVVIGIVLVVRSRRARAYPACGRCGYDVTRSIGHERCPECGAVFADVGIAPPHAGRGRLVGGLLLISLPLLCLLSGVVASMVSNRQAQAARAAAQTQLQAIQTQLEADEAALEAEAGEEDPEEETIDEGE
jgi:hypothetical protein